LSCRIVLTKATKSDGTFCPKGNENGCLGQLARGWQRVLAVRGDHRQGLKTRMGVDMNATFGLEFLREAVENRGGKVRGWTPTGLYSIVLGGVNYRIELEGLARLVNSLPRFVKDSMLGKRR
jgi:hypothetical protein